MDYTALSDVNTGFNQTEYDKLNQYKQERYLRDYGRRAAQGMVEGAEGYARSAEGRLADAEGLVPSMEAMATRQAAEGLRAGQGAMGSAPAGPGAVTAFGDLGALGAGARGQARVQSAGLVDKAKADAAQARFVDVPGAYAMHSQFLAEMGTEADYEQAQWAATASMRNDLLNNYGEDKGGVSWAFVREAMQYPEGHPMRDRWIMEAYSQGKDLQATRALESYGANPPASYVRSQEQAEERQMEANADRPPFWERWG